MHMLEELTNRDPNEIDILLQKEVSFIFTHCTYLIDYNYAQRQHIQSVNRTL